MAKQKTTTTKKPAKTISKADEKKINDLVDKHVSKMEKKHKEIIMKLKEQHEIDVNGYGDKIVEYKKLVKHLNDTINKLESRADEIKNQNVEVLGYFKSKVSAQSWIDTQFLKGTQQNLNIVEIKKNTFAVERKN